MCEIYQRTLHFRKLRAIHEILFTLDGDYEEQCHQNVPKKDTVNRLVKFSVVRTD